MGWESAVWIILMIAEIKAPSRPEAIAKLDAFREAVLPSENYGVTLYQRDDLAGMALLDLKKKIEAQDSIDNWDQECLEIIKKGLR